MNKARPNHRSRWTSTEIELLRKLVGAKLPIYQIAAQMGRTQEGVRNKAALLGISIQS